MAADLISMEGDGQARCEQHTVEISGIRCFSVSKPQEQGIPRLTITQTPDEQDIGSIPVLKITPPAATTATPETAPVTSSPFSHSLLDEQDMPRWFVNPNPPATTTPILHPNSPETIPTPDTAPATSPRILDRFVDEQGRPQWWSLNPQPPAATTPTRETAPVTSSRVSPPGTRNVDPIVSRRITEIESQLRQANELVARGQRENDKKERKSAASTLTTTSASLWLGRNLATEETTRTFLNSAVNNSTIADKLAP
jgi:hypothetical protein